MRKKLVFNLVDRDKYFDSLRMLHGGSVDVKEEKAKEADSKLEDAKADTKRVPGM